MVLLRVPVTGDGSGRGLRLREVRVDDLWIALTLEGGRRLRVPTAWVPGLRRATGGGRARYRLVAGRRGVWWPEVGEVVKLTPVLLRGGRRRGSRAAGREKSSDPFSLRCPPVEEGEMATRQSRG